MVEYIITGEPQRIERFDYPLDAIREIVINMIVHRDYRDSSGSIIKIFDDRIEFYNPGKLYGGITIKDLLSGNYISKSRNKLIAKAFKEVGLIERYGSGIMRIYKICKEYGIKEPDFKEISNGFMVTLFKETVKDTDKDTNKDTDKDTDKDTEKISIIQNKIIKEIKENSKISISELSSLIGINIRNTKKNILKLKESGRLVRYGANKGGYWKVNE